MYDPAILRPTRARGSGFGPEGVLDQAVNDHYGSGTAIDGVIVSLELHAGQLA
ncbi:hypothetical protein [Kitasatospora sp. NPDC085464]|uniref:hypothetical protein n=1 Tax=Kitasatospora sp. NPDC085464 TaxID=3364063 RepID=UPI0037C9CB0C